MWTRTVPIQCYQRKSARGRRRRRRTGGRPYQRSSGRRRHENICHHWHSTSGASGSRLGSTDGIASAATPSTGTVAAAERLRGQHSGNPKPLDVTVEDEDADDEGGHPRHSRLGSGAGGKAQEFPSVRELRLPLIPSVYGVSDGSTHGQLPASAGRPSPHGSHSLCDK